jgi:hypothetical protein
LSADVVDKINALFPKGFTWSGSPERWNELNRAEQLVGARLTPAQLAIEFRSMLDQAKEEALSSLATHEERKRLFEAPEADLDIRRAAYLSLLDQLQWIQLRRRFQRRLREDVASRLLSYGMAAALMALLVVVITFGLPTARFPLWASEALRLASVAAFGVLGAYFSRVIAFQSHRASLDLEEVTKHYVDATLRVRMLYGMIGAIIFYYLIRSGLITGELFPNLEGLDALQGEKPAAADPGGAPPNSPARASPAEDWARLLVWSFVAGFSERLVPDRLGQTEGRASREGEA